MKELIIYNLTYINKKKIIKQDVRLMKRSGIRISTS